MEQKKSTKYILIAISVLFIFVMLILPLFSILFSALKEGFAFYIQAVTTEYVRSALLVTLLATVIAVIVNTFFGIVAAWLLTKFSFRGKQVLATLIDIPFSISPVIVGLAFFLIFGRLGWTYPAIRAINQFFGTNIRITFALPGVVLATIFVTFPFVSREIIPILNAQGKDEEEAAALMGAGGFTIFRKITLPQMKWGLIYGIILCTARALGEFGAVNALSKTRGQTFTLPLEIDALYMSGTYTVQNKQHFAGCQKIIQTLAAHFTYGNNSLRRFGIGNFFQYLVAHADELNLLGRSLFQHGAGAVILNRSIKNALHGAVTHCLFHSTQAFRQEQALLLTIFLLLQLRCSLHHWVLQSGKFHLVSPLYVVTLLFYYYTNIFKPTSISRLL